MLGEKNARVVDAAYWGDVMRCDFALKANWASSLSN